MQFSQVLIDTLNELPYIQAVWLDSNGNYYLSQKADCSWYSRNEILGVEPGIEAEAATTEVVEPEAATENEGATHENEADDVVADNKG